MATVPQAVTDAVSAALDTSYTQGKADQSLTDAGALAMAQASITGLQAQVTELEAELAAEDPPPPPPPPEPTLALGMDFEPTTQAHEALAKAARLYLPAGLTDVTTYAPFKRAYAAGVRTFVPSWKDTSTASIGPMLDSFPDDCTVYGVAHHEPEEMTPTAWKALQAAHMPVVRAHGAIPTAIFTSFTLSPKSPLHFADWVCPAGTHDVLGFDYYPDKEPAFTQAQVVARWKPAMATFGVSRLLIGEYGVVNGSTSGVQTIADFKALIADLVEVALYWSNQASGKTNYRFTDATATAWLS